MANEEIKLVGSFKDEITPQLKKLTKQIEAIGRSFSKFNRNLRPISKEFGRMASSARTFNDALAQQNKLMSRSSRAMRDYKSQAGKMNGAMRAMQVQREKAMRQSGQSRSQMRSNRGRGSGGGMPYAPIPAPRMPKATRAPKMPKVTKAAPMAMAPAGGQKFGASAGQSFAATVGGSAIGTTIGMMASQAIMAGVQGLGRLLAAPFQKFSAAFAERIGDEMDDIKSAGGLFALDMDLTQESGNERFFKNYNESLRFQEKLNIDMAESAAALPGVTSQYVSTSRQLTDTIQMVMEKDRESFSKMAARFGADISMGGVEASKNAMQTVLKKQTEQVMLQSMGQQGGLPMHIMLQQLMGKEAKNGKLGIQAFTNRFRAAFQKNPLLKNFLLRAEEDLAKTDASSVERMQKIIEVFDAAMPKQVINKMRGSLSGMQEALRSGLLDPQAGLFGMSRANIASAEAVAAGMADAQGKLLKRNVNDYGEFLFTLTENAFDADIAKDLDLEEKANLKGKELTLEQLKKLGYEIDKQGKIVNKQTGAVAEASTSTTYLFEQMREILAGFGPVVLEFVGFLPQLFDPFTKMTEALMPLRDQAQEFIAGFNKNIDVFEKIATEMAGSADAAEAGLGSTLKGQSRGRAAIGKVVKFLEGVGGIDKDLAGNVLDVVGDVSKSGIEGYDKKITEFIEPLFRSLIESDLAKALSKGFGQIVGGIIRTVYDMITGIFSLAEGGAANALVEGFQEGFGSMFEDIEGGMGGMMAKLTDIFTMVMVKIGEILVTKVIPAMVQQVINMIMSGFTKGPMGILISGTLILGLVSSIKLVVGGITGLAASAYQASIALMGIAKNPMLRGAVGQAGGAMKGMGATAAATKTGGKAAKALAPLAKIGKGVKGKAVGALAAGVVKMSTAAPGLMKMGKAMVGLGKSIPLLNVAFAGLDFAAEKASGASTAQAAGSAGGGLVGSIIGGALGSFLGPIGTALGAMLGGWLGSELGKAIANMDFSWVADAWNAFTGFLGDAWASISSGASDAWNSITGTIGEVWEGFTGALGNAWESVATGAGDMWNNVTGTIGGVWNTFTGALGNAWDAVSGEAAEFMDDPFYYIGAKIREGILGVVNIAKTAFDAYTNFWLVTVPGILTNAWTGIISFFTEAVPQAFEALKQGIQSKIFEFQIGIEMLGIKAAEGFENLKQSISSAIFELAISINVFIIKAVEEIKSFFTTTLPAIFEEIKAVLSNMIEGIKGAISGFAESIAALPGQISQGLQGVADAIVNWVRDLPGKVTGAFGSFMSGLTGGGKGKSSYKGNFPGRARIAAGGQNNGFTMGELASATAEAASAELAFASSSYKAADAVLGSGKSAGKAIEAISGNWMSVNSAAASGLATAAQGMGAAISGAAAKLKNAASSISGKSSDGDTKAGVAYNGLMNLNDAVATEMKYKPPGSDLVIANSSETIIPAYKGNFPDGQDTYKGLDFGTMEMASGFNRMKSHTEQLSELADKTASNFTAGFGGALGGGSATLNAMEALGHSFGLTTTSGHRPGDPGFHGVNRARDLSNGGGETPEMNAAAAKMASEFGSSLTELIYTPMGFSIKNGQKTGLISPDNHYHHIHVAVAEGLAKAAVFQSEKAALSYEKANMPAGSEPMRVDLSSMTANSSEVAGGGAQSVTMGDINVSVSGVDDPKAIANQVAGEILHAIEKATYTELFTS